MENALQFLAMCGKNPSQLAALYAAAQNQNQNQTQTQTLNEENQLGSANDNLGSSIKEESPDHQNDDQSSPKNLSKLEENGIASTPDQKDSSGNLSGFENENIPASPKNNNENHKFRSGVL